MFSVPGTECVTTMLAVTATPQPLVSNLEQKRYRLHEILPFTNLCWPLVCVLDFPRWAARVENIGRLSSIHFSFLPGLSRPHLSVLPWLQVWFCPPERGVLSVGLFSPTSTSQAHTPTSLPESLSPATPAAVTESLGFFVPSLPVHPYPHRSLFLGCSLLQAICSPRAGPVCASDLPCLLTPKSIVCIQ